MKHFFGAFCSFLILIMAWFFSFGMIMTQKDRTDFSKPFFHNVDEIAAGDNCFYTLDDTFKTICKYSNDGSFQYVIYYSSWGMSHIYVDKNNFMFRYDIREAKAFFYDEMRQGEK